MRKRYQAFVRRSKYFARSPRTGREHHKVVWRGYRQGREEKDGLIHVPFPNASLCSHIVSAVQMQSLLLTQKTKPGNELGMTALVWISVYLSSIRDRRMTSNAHYHHMKTQYATSFILFLDYPQSCGTVQSHRRTLASVAIPNTLKLPIKWDALKEQF